MLADGVAQLAAAGEGAHDGGAAADIGTVAHDHTLRNAAFDHGDAERAGIEVHESGVHHGGAGRQVSAEAHAVGVADTHAGGHYVIDHARELIHTEHVDGGGRSCGRQSGLGGESESGFGGGAFDVGLAQREVFNGEGAVVGPHHIGELGEDAVEVQRVRLGHAHAHQMEFQVSVRGVADRLVQLADDEYRHAADATGVGFIVSQSAEIVVWTIGLGRCLTEIQFGVPDVQGGAGGVYAGQTPSPCGTLFAHSCSLHIVAFALHVHRGM